MVARHELSWVTLNQFHQLYHLHQSPGFVHPRAMPQSLAKILVHTVFSTRERRPFLRDTALREELHRYLTPGVASLAQGE